MSTISPYATSGFASASAYDANRPSYPPTAVSSLLSALKLQGVKGARIIDLAAGTGKFTELLAKREEEYEILAIEPHEGMRGELVRKGLKGVEVKDGTAEKMGVERGWADAVICAQVCHWGNLAACIGRLFVDTSGNENCFASSLSTGMRWSPRYQRRRLRHRRFSNDEALEEIYKALIPGGPLGIIWNVEDCVISSHLLYPSIAHTLRQRTEKLDPEHAVGGKDEGYNLVFRRFAAALQAREVAPTFREAAFFQSVHHPIRRPFVLATTWRSLGRVCVLAKARGYMG